MITDEAKDNSVVDRAAALHEVVERAQHEFNERASEQTEKATHSSTGWPMSSRLSPRVQARAYVGQAANGRFSTLTG